MSGLRTVPKLSWLLVIVSAVLQVAIFPKLGWSALGWICLAPLFYALLNPPSMQVLSATSDDADGLRGSPPSLTAAQGFWLGYLCGVICYAGSCYWIYRTMLLYGGLSPALSVAVLFLFSLYLGLYHGFFGALLVRISQKRTFVGARALLMAPFLWTAVELARSRITGFPWDPLGTAAVDNIPLTRLATITGVYGLSFVIAIVNVLFAAVFLAAPSRRRRFAFTAAAAALFLHAGVLIQPQAFNTTHTARLVQENIPIFEAGVWTARFYEETIATIVKVSEGAGAGNSTADSLSTPHLIIWPESPAPFYVNDPKFRESLSQLANASDSFVIAGSLGLESPLASASTDDDKKTKVFNSAALVGPSGAFLARYDKIHLVPFGEYVPFQSLLFFAEKLTKEVGTFSRGNSRNVFALSREATGSEMPGHPGMAANAAPSAPVPGEVKKAGVFICYESVFPDEVRLFALNGANVFVNISNDGWYGDSSAPLQLLNMSRMRSIENGRWLLRATNTGITSSIDPYGRVVARAERNVRSALDAPYAFVTGTTYYTRHGDWFAYSCAIISLAAIFIRLNLRAAVLR